MNEDWERLAQCNPPPCRKPGCTHRAGCPRAALLRRQDKFFFPEGKRAESDRAIETCLRCPVWAECLTKCAESEFDWGYGVYGGLWAYERRKRRGVPDLAGAIRKAEGKRGLVERAS